MNSRYSAPPKVKASRATSSTMLLDDEEEEESSQASLVDEDDEDNEEEEKGHSLSNISVTDNKKRRQSESIDEKKKEEKPRAEKKKTEKKKKSKTKATSLNTIAKELHAAGEGSENQSTTGVGRLANGTLVVATQIAITAAMLGKAAEYGIATGDVFQTYGAGYHVEVSMYIKYRAQLTAVGASQGFCPECQKFVKAKALRKEGEDRNTAAQVWYSPEFYDGVEKTPADADYLYALFKDDVEGKRIKFQTQKALLAWRKERGV